MRDRLAECARDLGIKVQVQRLEASTRTVADAACAVGCQEAEIAKSIVFVADGDPVVCVASGKHRVDVEKVADALDVAEVRHAQADEVRAATGFAIGGDFIEIAIGNALTEPGKATMREVSISCQV